MIEAGRAETLRFDVVRVCRVLIHLSTARRLELRGGLGPSPEVQVGRDNLWGMGQQGGKNHDVP
jgi:hypothetical protein